MYDHFDSIKACIESVIEFVDLKRNSLLIVNDCGPDADAIEAKILAVISGVAGINYARNKKNLGFVLTCNRAVLELDLSDNDVLLLNSDARLTKTAFEEMVKVLSFNEKHGVVFPRSNNAAIASIPLLPLDLDGVDEQVAAHVFSELQAHLPRYVITPIGVGFCFLVKRQLIRNYGFFDSVYSPGYSEENDLCLRVNKFGYSSVMANHAFVFHEGTRSFDESTRDTLKRRHEDIMIRRYPYYHDAVAHYLQFGVDPIDWFADLLFVEHRPKVLIDLYHMSLIYNGSTRNALTFLDLIAQVSEKHDVEFVLVSSREAIQFFDLTRYGFRVVENGILEETFDLGFALSPVSDPNQIRILNRNCIRWVVSHFDVIALRILSLLEMSYTRRQVVLDSLVLADRVIPISNSALDDIEDYFGSFATSVREHSTVIHEGVAETSFDSKKSVGGRVSLPEDQQAAIDRGGYALVIGNIFTHKQFPETLAALDGIDLPIVALGALRDKKLAGSATFIEGGHLSDEEIDRLYRQAACVVFPSSYEGFGLPIAEAAERGKPLVVFDSDVAHEVVDSLGVSALTTFFSLFDELPDLVRAAAARSTTNAAVLALRPLSAYNEGILAVLLDELAKPVDLEKLRRRFDYFRAIEIYGDVLERQLNFRGADGAYQVFSRVLPLFEPLRPAFRLLRRVRRRLRRPRR